MLKKRLVALSLIIILCINLIPATQFAPAVLADAAWTKAGGNPVFGPGAKSLAHHNFVLTPTNDKEAALAAKVKQYLEERKANVAVMTPAEHDEMMTVVLALAHFIAIVAGDTLLGFEKLAAMQPVGGTTFKLLYTLVESVISEDPQLYASLQMSFPDAAKVEGQFIRKAQLWAQ